MTNIKVPHIGYRNIKTALAVLICLVFLNNSLMASIAAIISMQSTIEDSVSTGINRLLGTLLGGTLGVIILYFISIFSLQNYSILISALSVSLIIYICNLINKPAACVISSIVVLGIVIDPGMNNQISYAITRTIETSLGVIIAVLVNRFINPPNKTKGSLISEITKGLDINIGEINKNSIINNDDNLNNPSDNQNSNITEFEYDDDDLNNKVENKNV